MVPVYTTVGQAKRVVSAYLSRPQEAVYFDTETSGKLYREDKLVTIQLMQGNRAAVVFDVRDRPEVVQALGPIFPKLLIVGHNLKFDGNWLLQYGIRLKRVFDTQLAEQVIYGRGLGDEERKHNDLPMSLLAVAARRGIEMSKGERDWFFKPVPLHTRPEWHEPLPQEQVEYAAKDITVLRDIAIQQQAELTKRKLMPVAKLEMRVLPAFIEMEHTGIHINVEGWQAFIAAKDVEAKQYEGQVLAELGAAILDARIREYDTEMAVYTAARDGLVREETWAKECWEFQGKTEPWGEFKKRAIAEYRSKHVIPPHPKLDLKTPNIGSTDQLISGLEVLGIPVPTKNNPKGEVVKTTESKALEPLGGERYPAVTNLLKWRKASKFVSSFGESLIARRDKNDRIHPQIKQIGADTGRSSMTEPNFQQIPSRGDGKLLRKNVTAAAGNVLVVADFSNIEARIVANITEDPAMLGAFAQGIDLHTDTARRVFNLEGDWDKRRASDTEWKRGWSYRDVGKMLNFLQLYGGSAYKMAMELGIPPKEAEAIIARYFQDYRGVERWMTQTKRGVHRSLASRTLAGRARFFSDPGPEPDSYAYRGRYQEYDEALRAWRKAWGAIERQSLNSPIQGTSADITKLAVALFYEHCDHRIGRLIVVVHDELVVECPERHAGIVRELLADAMKEACDTYLKTSPVPRPEPTISSFWEHD